MEIVETANEGLKRAYKITIPAADIDARVDSEIKRIAPQVRMPGFRPGKVPPNLIRKMHGEALMQDALSSAVQESVQQAIEENKLRPALEPAVELDEGYAPGGDAEVKVALDVLPDISAPELDDLKLERLSVEVGEEEVDAALERLAGQQKSFETAPKSHKARTGDVVMIDYEGKIDGEPFEGGKGEEMAVELGSGQLIPGFEEQLEGLKANDAKTVKVSFPDDYNVETLRGKKAEFDVVVGEVRTPGKTEANDAFAESLGLESLDQLRELLRSQIEQELNGLTRTHMKRQLLDRLAADHDFAVPESMVETEFDQIWKQLEQEAEREDDPDAAREEMEQEREDYHAIAVRRVRLGLLLSEIGQANKIEVSQQEMAMLINQAAQQYPAEQRERFVEYVQKTPLAAAQLRAPMFEDKVIDFLFEKAEISDRKVSREELEEAIEAIEDHADEETASEKGGAAKPAAKKKSPPKKTAPKKTAAKKTQSKKSAAKKPASKEANPGESAAKKPAAKKPAAKKPAAKKAAAKKEASGKSAS